MKKKFWIVILLALIVFLFLVVKFDKIKDVNLIQKKTGGELTVNRVIDGDTIEVMVNNKKESVRLIGIDAPELTDSSMKGKLALESRDYLKKLVQNKKIRLEADETQEDRDNYQRLLRYVYLDDGTLVNKKMIEAGMAEEYTYKTPYKFQWEFREAGRIFFR